MIYIERGAWCSDGRFLSVSLAVQCKSDPMLRPKDRGCWKLAGMKLMTWVTPDPIRGRKVKGPKPLSSERENQHSFGTERRPTNFKLGILMEYDDPHYWHALRPPTCKLWVAVPVTTCRGRGHTVAAPLQAVQLVYFNIGFVLLFTTLWWNFDTKISKHQLLLIHWAFCHASA